MIGKAGATGRRGAAGTGVAAVMLTVGAAVAQQPLADTVPPATVRESEYTFRSGELTLSGTLTLPADGARGPVAVLVAGSGPTDRNGNASPALRTNMYAQLAWGLAERGVASLRYDKRVLPVTRGPVDVARLTLDDFAGDVAAAVRSLVGEGRFAQVVVVGHSEGGALAIRAVRSGLTVSGIALVATAGRTLPVLLREQVGRQVDPATLMRFESAMTQYLRGIDPPDVPPALMPLFLPVNRRFMQSVAAFDPAAELRETALPVLIVQGGSDLQVRARDAEALRAARPDATLLMLPDVNHVLKTVADTTLGAQLGTYRDPTLPLAPRVVEGIVTWIGTLR